MSVELACAAPAYLDLTFVGLRALPGPGQEEFAKRGEAGRREHGLCPGGRPVALPAAGERDHV